MNDDAIAVTGGVDCHQRTHHAAALDSTGRLLGDAEFAATQRGYEALLAWLQTFGTIVAVGVESTGAYGAGLTRHLRAADVTVIEVNNHTRTRAAAAARPTPSTPRPPPARSCPAKPR